MRQEILLFDEGEIPEGSANGTRIVSFAQIFQNLGYDVLMLGLNYNFSKVATGVYEGVPYELLTFKELALLGGLNRIKRFKAMRAVLEQWIRERKSRKHIAAILYSGSDAVFFRRISKNEQIPIIYNLVEWFPYAMFTGLRGFIRYLLYIKEFHYDRPRLKNIIAISSLLEDFAKSKGCNVIRIPTIVDLSTYDVSTINSHKSSNKLILAYAGKIGQKDEMVNVFKALALLDKEELDKIELHLYGNDNDAIGTYAHNSAWGKLIGKQIICHGMIPYKEVRTEIQKADFTILLRKQWLNANAGFPTKVGESMAAGVPVIANLTSDIGLYLHDGVEGLVCKDDTPEECVKTLRRAMALTADEKIQMRRNARAQAEKGFNYLTYVPIVQKFMKSLQVAKL